ncbi:MAG TPA: CHASE3 domain-containing protein, partial [Pyrinomonadaceae bacterium]
MALRTEQKLPLILFVVFLTLSTIGFLFYQGQASYQEALDWQRQSNSSIRLADETARMMMNVDLGVFGFAHTGNDSYLEPYNRAKTVVPQNIARLKQNSADDPEALAQIALLETAVKEVLAEADRKIEARKVGGPDEGLRQITNIADRPRMDAVQAAVRQIKDTVTAKMQARDKRLDLGLSGSVWILTAASLTGIIALGLANFVVYREIRKRQSAESELIDTNRSLEEKVEERTEELLEMNERLVEIGGERELLLIGEKQARQEAEVANRLRDEFMATVSHELRTPLNSILGWARLLKDGTLDLGQTQRAVNTIIKNSETQNRLIEDLLDVARLISGKLELEEEPVDLVQVISDSIEIASPAAQQKRLRIELDQGFVNGGSIVCGDRDRLRQVFSNLITNAIKFSHDAGSIHVQAFQDASV